MVTAAALVFFLMMMVMLMLSLELCQFSSQGSLAFHGLQQLCAGQFTPGSRDNRSFRVVFPQHFHRGVQLLLGNRVSTGQDDGGGGLDLVVVELTKILHIDLHFTSIHNCHCVAQSHVLAHDLIHGADNIGQLTNTGGLDENPVGMILLNHLLQSLAEVTHQRTADAAGVHFGNIDAGILQETTVDADFTELILNEDQLLACVSLLDHFLNQSGFACTQKTTVNINFGHSYRIPS